MADPVIMYGVRFPSPTGAYMAPDARPWTTPGPDMQPFTTALPHIDHAFTEQRIREIVREEIAHLDNAKRIAQLEELIDALAFVHDLSALSDGDERSQLVREHIDGLRAELARLKG